MSDISRETSYARSDAMQHYVKIQDFDNEPNVVAIANAIGITTIAQFDEKPYVYGASARKARIMRQAWNAQHPEDPMP